MDVVDYIWLGVLAVFQGPVGFSVLDIQIPITILMIFSGFLLGVVVGATPGLAGPMAMAIALPILISVFGFSVEALLPVFGFLIGIMKGATVGGAVPAILFNTPGTPDALLTTLDGYPMTQNGQSGKALRIAHFSSASGDTFSDIVLFICAPFLAVLVESYLDFPEKTALILVSLAFIASVIGKSVAKGLIAASLGLLFAYVGTGEDFTPRLTMGIPGLENGFPIATAILGVMILGEVFKSIEDIWVERSRTGKITQVKVEKGRLNWSEIRQLFPYIRNSALVGTCIGALPGVGSTLAATLGYSAGKKHHANKGRPMGPQFGEGAPEGVASTEAANSSVSGANLIPVLSLGIPGNAAAVFLILAADSITGFNPGPSVFKFSEETVNNELVIVFGIFTLMVIANLFNWLLGRRIMGLMGTMIRVPKQVLLPIILILTLTAIYVQEASISAMGFAFGFGLLGYFMRRLGISVLPFVIAFILAGSLEQTARQAFSATGGNPWFLFSSPLSIALMVAAVVVVVLFSRKARSAPTISPMDDPRGKS